MSTTNGWLNSTININIIKLEIDCSCEVEVGRFRRGILIIRVSPGGGRRYHDQIVGALLYPGNLIGMYLDNDAHGAYKVLIVKEYLVPVNEALCTPKTIPHNLQAVLSPKSGCGQAYP